MAPAASRPHRPRATFRPMVEALEDRRVPAISVFQTPGSNLLVITGTDADDVVRINDTGDSLPGAVSVTGTGLGGVFRSFAPPPGQVLRVLINTGGGNDLVLYNLRGDVTSRFTAAAFNSLLLSPSGFTGNNAFTPGLDTTGFTTPGLNPFPPATTLSNQFPVGTTGFDTVGFGAPTFPSTVFLGGTTQGVPGVGLTGLGTPLLGTTPFLGGRNIFADLGRGNDTFILNANRDVDVLANSILTVNVNGALGADRINLGFQGTVIGDLALTARGGSGVFNDQVLVQQVFAAGSTGIASAQVFGGPGNDRLILLIDRTQPNLSLLNTAQVFGGVGFNTGLLTPGVFATNVVTTPSVFPGTFVTTGPFGPIF